MQQWMEAQRLHVPKQPRQLLERFSLPAMRIYPLHRLGQQQQLL